MPARLSIIAFLTCTVQWAANALAGGAPMVYATSQTNGTVGAYSSSTGIASNAALISGLSTPSELALFDGKLYVADAASHSVDVYDATTGAPVKVPLVSGLSAPYGIAVSASDLYIADYSTNTIGKYNRADGTVENASLITGLHAPAFVTIDGTDLYVSNQGDGSDGAGVIGKYTTNGTTENASFITGLSAPGQTAVVGGSIYIPNYGIGTIGIYDTSTGDAIDDSFITELDFPWGLAITGSTLLVGNLNTGTVGSYDLGSGKALNAALFSGGPRLYALAAAPSTASHGVLVTTSQHSGKASFTITNQGNVTTAFRVTFSTQGATAKRPKHSRNPWVSISYILGGQTLGGSPTQATTAPLLPGKAIVLTTKLRVRGGRLTARKRIATTITATDLSDPSATGAAKSKVRLAVAPK